MEICVQEVMRKVCFSKDGVFRGYATLQRDLEEFKSRVTFTSRQELKNFINKAEGKALKVRFYI